ncbi:hypothetical protein Glove_34g30 [Diversispora epigaea]|uniref:HAT C-terminal dimerisation domain-containing protein n=1 Tax=Diversispora epigaea TaxID=1348612 RepID=A0A397JJP7_9GLOM|nr:hypothetical protein Glove_34g30 [Diversispora epigaea]
MPLYDWTRKGDVLHLREQSGHGELPTHILGEQNVNADRISVRNSSLEPYILEETFVSPNQCVMARTFSTAGRIINDYRSNLTLETVETLICSQDWLKSIKERDWIN